MQKYIFDGEIGKNMLEAKNVVACTSFLLEQKLVILSLKVSTLPRVGSAKCLIRGLCLHVIYLCILNVKIKAWLADKDAEALRCQNLLVEEEEAAQRRCVLINCSASHIALLNGRFSYSELISKRLVLFTSILCLEQTS